MLKLMKNILDIFDRVKYIIKVNFIFFLNLLYVATRKLTSSYILWFCASHYIVLDDAALDY